MEEKAVEVVEVAGIRIGGDSPLVIIAGPCVIEDMHHALRHAWALQKLSMSMGVPVIYKSSFDKANRSSLHSYRGPGIEDGLEILNAVKQETGLPVTTDVHTQEQAGLAAEVVDLLQVPAFLCRQTSLLVAAAKTGKPVNVKKGQFMSPWDTKNIVEKIRATAGPGKCLLTERGTSFGYNNLVVDFRSIPVMRSSGVPVVFDGTHSVQLPGAGTGGTSTGGQREFVPFLVLAAAAVGMDALFLEVHEDPDNAPCDGPNMLCLEDFPGLVEKALVVRNALKSMP
ncbi:MAG: 3-deoxy-8-phosphooctulonate synthase [Deltaproteobacteria bacterium]|nr:3-deoxy-8-phosphooctulonate synthase [Deltaproteobacteria bacterium]